MQIKRIRTMCCEVLVQLEKKKSLLLCMKMNRRLGHAAINIYTDKDTGKPKGDATLSYEEPICAKAAVEHFDGMPRKQIIVLQSLLIVNIFIKFIQTK